MLKILSIYQFKYKAGADDRDLTILTKQHEEYQKQKIIKSRNPSYRSPIIDRESLRRVGKPVRRPIRI